MSAERYAIQVAMNIDTSQVSCISSEIEAFAEHMGRLIATAQGVYIDAYRGVAFDFYPAAAAEAVAAQFTKATPLDQRGWRMDLHRYFRTIQLAGTNN